jgi:hypothetical protein
MRTQMFAATGRPHLARLALLPRTQGEDKFLLSA